MQEEGSYFCNACGEEIVIPLDVSAGREQEYVEDCPVCCRPNLLRITWCNETADINARPE
ncbi:MAG: CPXCG motif-containing cysteine-rich protein [Planctomycetaceae bacterium]|nr:CPXCG motif-containing cysteine-rich protein [Planctomycetaceae bacterium]